MFQVYVLKSEETGGRYIGCCEYLEERVRRHDLGHSKSTRQGLLVEFDPQWRPFRLAAQQRGRSDVTTQVALAMN
jgi:hypothetical protein